MANKQAEKDDKTPQIPVKPPITPIFSDEDPDLTPERYWERRQRNS